MASFYGRHVTVHSNTMCASIYGFTSSQFEPILCMTLHVQTCVQLYHCARPSSLFLPLQVIKHFHACISIPYLLNSHLYYYSSHYNYYCWPKGDQLVQTPPSWVYTMGDMYDIHSLVPMQLKRLGL